MFDQTKAIENMLSSARKHVTEHSNIFGLQCFRTGLSGVFGYEVTQKQQVSVQCLIVGNAQDDLVGTIHRQKTISCVMPKTMARDHNQEQRQNQKHTQT